MEGERGIWAEPERQGECASGAHLVLSRVPRTGRWAGDALLSLEEQVERANRAGWSVMFAAARSVCVSRGAGKSTVRHQRRVRFDTPLAEALGKLLDWIETEES